MVSKKLFAKQFLIIIIAAMLIFIEICECMLESWFRNIVVLWFYIYWQFSCSRYLWETLCSFFSKSRWIIYSYIKKIIYKITSSLVSNSLMLIHNPQTAHSRSHTHITTNFFTCHQCGKSNKPPVYIAHDEIYYVALFVPRQ